MECGGCRQRKHGSSELSPGRAFHHSNFYRVFLCSLSESSPSWKRTLFLLSVFIILFEFTDSNSLLLNENSLSSSDYICFMSDVSLSPSTLLIPIRICLLFDGSCFILLLINKLFCTHFYKFKFI